MTLSDEQIHAFIEAWNKDFGDILSFDTAKVEATRLVEFFVQMHETLTSRDDTEYRGNNVSVLVSPHAHHLRAAWNRRSKR